jgi:uncharacterized protein YeaO (DUF488 family)
MPDVQTTDLLDRVLRDLSPEQRARVLDLVVRLDLDKDDPLWLIAIAVGQLQVLVQDAPEEWQNVFESFRAELQAWTETNLQTLEAIAKQAESGEALSETVKELTSSFSALTKVLTAQIKQSTNPGQSWSRFERTLESWRSSLNSRLDSFITESSKILLSVQNTNPTSMSRSGSSPIANLSINAILAISLGVGFWVLWQGQQQSNEKLQWLLQKMTRQECASGVKTPDSVECRQFKQR